MTITDELRDADLRIDSEEASRCCDSCERTTRTQEWKTAFQRGWNKGHARGRSEAIEKTLRLINNNPDMLAVVRSMLDESDAESPYRPS